MKYPFSYDDLSVNRHEDQLFKEGSDDMMKKLEDENYQGGLL